MPGSETSEPQDSRMRVLRATLRLVGSNGIAAARDEEQVAAAAGVEVDELRSHFADSSALLREALRLRVEEEVERFDVIIAGMSRNPPSVEDAAAVVEGVVWADPGAEHLAELELQLQGARDPELQEVSRRCFEAYERFAMGVLGALSLPATEANARAIVALVTGLAVRRLATGDVDAAGTYDALITIIRGAGTSP